MGKSLVLLHGALGSKDQLTPLAQKVEKELKVYTFNFMGHGGEAIPEKMDMNDLVDQLHSYINTNIPLDDHLTIFGYSMGGYAALLLGSKEICRIDQIITLGTKLHWDKETATREIKMLDAEIMKEKVPAFAKELSDRHQPADWELLLKRTADLMMDLSVHQYMNEQTISMINCPCKLMLGDKDKMVTLNETVSVVKWLKNGSLSVLPSTIHPIEKVDINRLAFEILNS